MKLGFLVNAVEELIPTQTTSMLIHQAALAGHQANVLPIASLHIDPDGTIRGNAVVATAHGHVAETVAALHKTAPTPADMTALDALMIRTNPARDPRLWAHDMALECAALLEDRGVFVANRPAALRRSMSKAMLTRMPISTRPVTMVTRDFVAFENFLAEAPGDIVAKPLAGTRGSDVFRIARGSPNVRQIFDVLTRNGYCVAQHFVPDALKGDIRIVLLDGKPLQSGGQLAAVRRIPGSKDFRSNIAVGGTAAPEILTDEMRAVADLLATQLAAEGLWLVGLDLIGTQVVEINVFSTGGLRHAELFYEQTFTRVIIDWLVDRATQKKPR